MVALISSLSLILCFASQSKRIAYVAKCIPESSAPETRNGQAQAQLMWAQQPDREERRREWALLWVVKSFAWQFGYVDNYRAEVEIAVIVEILVNRTVPGGSLCYDFVGKLGEELAGNPSKTLIGANWLLHLPISRVMSYVLCSLPPILQGSFPRYENRSLSHSFIHRSSKSSRTISPGKAQDK